MTYRQNPALGGSDIRAMVADYERWHFERKLKLAGELPAWLQPKTSPAAEFGTLVHMAILEPWLYADAVIMPYVENFALKAGKDAKRKAEEEAKEKGSFVVRHEHAWAIERIRESLGSLPEPTPETTEIECFATRYGVPVKGKIDWLMGEILVDVKTISDFHRRDDTLFKNNYHCQLAHYSDLGLEVAGVAILWIESVVPHRTHLQLLDSDIAQLGMVARDSAIKRYAGIEDSF